MLQLHKKSPGVEAATGPGCAEFLQLTGLMPNS
jgi:hypothetical protein